MGKNSFISNSKKLPKAAIAACVMTAITLVSISYFLVAVDSLPAPMLTGRISLDEKLRFMRNNDIKDVELAGMGSSIGLNNLSTDVMKKIPEFGNKYFNFSIWYVDISDFPKYWNFLSQFYHPKVMIMCMSPFDYISNTTIDFHEKDLGDYLNGKYPLLYYLKYRGMPIITRAMSIKRQRNNNDTFDTLNFDSGGSANIDDIHQFVTEKRWNKKFNGEINDKNYGHLDQMMRQLKEEGVQVVYVVSPMRAHNFKEDQARIVARRHWDKVRSIVDKHGMHFLNMHEILSFDDRFFVDGKHLKKTGADLFTKRMLEEIEKRQWVNISLPCEGQDCQVKSTEVSKNTGSLN